MHPIDCKISDNIIYKHITMFCFWRVTFILVSAFSVKKESFWLVITAGALTRRVCSTYMQVLAFYVSVFFLNRELPRTLYLMRVNALCTRNCRISLSAVCRWGCDIQHYYYHRYLLVHAMKLKAIRFCRIYLAIDAYLSQLFLSFIIYLKDILF